MSWYEQHTENQLRGRQVRARRELRNGTFIIPSGSVGTISRKFGGLNVDFAACTHCGMRPRITRVPASALDLLPPQEPT